MTLEEEIKQNKFKNNHIKAGVNILFTASYITNYQSKIFRKFGLTAPQFNVLRILRGQLPNPATINLIIERMLDKSSNASRIVEKLRIKNQIERIQCPEDRRAVNVKITDQGLEVLKKLDELEADFFGGLNKLNEEELNILNNLLNKTRL